MKSEQNHRFSSLFCFCCMIMVPTSMRKIALFCIVAEVCYLVLPVPASAKMMTALLLLSLLVLSCYLYYSWVMDMITIITVLMVHL